MSGHLCRKTSKLNAARGKVVCASIVEANKAAQADVDPPSSALAVPSARSGLLASDSDSDFAEGDLPLRKMPGRVGNLIRSCYPVPGGFVRILLIYAATHKYPLGNCQVEQATEIGRSIQFQVGFIWSC